MPHTIEVQRFFKEEIKSRGWYTHELRQVAVRFRRTILADGSQPFLLQVADLLFRGEIHEEKTFAVMLLQSLVKDFGMPEFRLFESWISRISNWADHDGLIHYLIGPMRQTARTLCGLSAGQERRAPGTSARPP